jgi:hypothetical protein
MADFLDEVASYLEDEGVGVFDTDSGRNIFVGEVPESPVNLVALLGATGVTLGDAKQIKTLNFPRFQAYIRNASYSDGSTKLLQVRTALHALYGEILPNYRVLACHADQEGGPLGKDPQGRYEFTINFTAEINEQVAP